MHNFGRRLRELREEKDMSLADLADNLNTVKSVLSRYENSKAEPSLDMVISAAKFFNVTLEYIVGEEEENLELDQCEKYRKVINKASAHNVTPDKLDKLIDIVKE